MSFRTLNFPILYGAESGYVHLLQLSSLSGHDLDDSDAEWDGHGGVSVAVTNVWESRTLDFGSNNILKTLRSTKIQMAGENITVLFTYTTTDGQVDTDSFSGITLPVDNTSFFEIDNDNRIFRNVKIKITGNNLELRQIAFLYRHKRFQ